MKIGKFLVILFVSFLYLGNSVAKSSNTAAKGVMNKYQINGRKLTVQEADKVVELFVKSGKTKSYETIIKEMEESLKQSTVTIAPSETQFKSIATLYELNKGNLSNVKEDDIVATEELITNSNSSTPSTITLEQIEDQKMPQWLKILKLNASVEEKNAARAVSSFPQLFFETISLEKLAKIVKLHSLYLAALTEEQYKHFEKVIALGTNMNDVLKEQVDVMSQLVKLKDITLIDEKDLNHGLKLFNLDYLEITAKHMDVLEKVLGFGGINMETLSRQHIDLGLSLKQAGYNDFDENEFKIGQKLTTFEHPVTDGKIKAIKALIDNGVQLEQVTVQKLSYAEQLNTLKDNFDQNDLEVIEKLVTGYLQSAEKVDLNHLKAGLIVKKLNLQYSENSVKDIQKIKSLGTDWDHITLDQTNVMSRLRVLNYQYGDVQANTFKLAEKIYALLNKALFSTEQMTAGQRLVSLGQVVDNLTLPSLEKGVKLISLGYGEFTSAKHMDVLEKVLGFGINMETISQQHMNVGLALKKVGYNAFTENEFKIGQKLATFEQPVTDAKIKAIKALINNGVQLDHVTVQKLSYAERLNTLKGNFDGDNLEVIEKLVTGYLQSAEKVDLNHLEAGLIVKKLNLQYSENNVKDIQKIKSLGTNWDQITQDQVDVMSRLRVLNYQYEDVQANTFKLAEKIYALLTKAPFSAEQMTAGQRLVSQGQNIETLTLLNLKTGTKLISLGYNEFTSNDIEILNKVKSFGGEVEAVTKSQMNAIEQLKKRGYRLEIISQEQFQNAAKLISFEGYENFTDKQFLIFESLLNVVTGVTLNNVTEKQMDIANRLLQLEFNVIDDENTFKSVLHFTNSGKKLNQIDAKSVRHGAKLISLNINDFSDGMLEKLAKAIKFLQNNLGLVTAQHLATLSRLNALDIKTQDVDEDTFHAAHGIVKGAGINNFENKHLEGAKALKSMTGYLINQANLGKVMKLIELKGKNVKTVDMDTLIDLLKIKNIKLETIQSYQLDVIQKYKKEKWNLKKLDLKKLNQAARLIQIGLEDFDEDYFKFLEKVMTFDVKLEEISFKQMNAIVNLVKSGVGLQNIDQDKFTHAVKMADWKLDENQFTSDNLKIMEKLLSFEGYDLNALTLQHFKAALVFIEEGNFIENLTKNDIEDQFLSIEDQVLEKFQGFFKPEEEKNEDEVKKDIIKTIFEHYEKIYPAPQEKEKIEDFIIHATDYIKIVINQIGDNTDLQNPQKRNPALQKQMNYVDQMYNFSHFAYNHGKGKAPSSSMQKHFMEFCVYMKKHTNSQEGLLDEKFLNEKNVKKMIEILKKATINSQFTNVQDISFSIRVLEKDTNMKEDVKELKILFEEQTKYWKHSNYSIYCNGSIYPSKDKILVDKEINSIFLAKKKNGFCLNYSNLTYDNLYFTVINKPIKGASEGYLEEAKILAKEFEVIAPSVIEDKNDEFKFFEFKYGYSGYRNSLMRLLGIKFKDYIKAPEETDTKNNNWAERIVTLWDKTNTMWRNEEKINFAQKIYLCGVQENSIYPFDVNATHQNILKLQREIYGDAQYFRFEGGEAQELKEKEKVFQEIHLYLKMAYKNNLNNTDEKINKTLSRFLGIKPCPLEIMEDPSNREWQQNKSWRERTIKLWTLCDKVVDQKIIRPEQDNYSEIIWKKALHEEKMKMFTSITCCTVGCPTGVSRSLTLLEKGYMKHLISVDLKTPFLPFMGAIIEKTLLNRLEEVLTFHRKDLPYTEEGQRLLVQFNELNTLRNQNVNSMRREYLERVMQENFINNLQSFEKFRPNPDEMNTTSFLILKQRLRMSLNLSGEFEYVVCPGYGAPNIPSNSPVRVMRTLFLDGEPNREFSGSTSEPHPTENSPLIPIRGKAICIKTLVDNVYNEFGESITMQILMNYIGSNPILLEENHHYCNFKNSLNYYTNGKDYEKQAESGSIFFTKECLSFESLKENHDPKVMFKPTLACFLLVDLGLIHMENELKNKLFTWTPAVTEEDPNDEDGIDEIIKIAPIIGTTSIPNGKTNGTLEDWINHF